MQSGMFVNGSIALMFMHMPHISSCLFVSWLCMDSQSAMNTCGPGLYSILYWCIQSIFLEAYVTCLQCLS